MKIRIGPLEAQLGLTIGMLRQWILRGHVPLAPSTRDGQLDLSAKQRLLLICIASLHKAVNMGLERGQGIGAGMRFYWAQLQEGFEWYEEALENAKTIPGVDPTLWTYCKDGVPHVVLTRNNEPPASAKRPLDLGAALENIRKDARRKKTIREMQSEYDFANSG